jgi:hypothetical protein
VLTYCQHIGRVISSNIIESGGKSVKKKVYGLFIVLFSLTIISVVIANAKTKCEESCVAAGNHCCTNAGPAIMTYQHPFFIYGQEYTCTEWTLRTYQSYTCIYCQWHWNETPLIDHAYMHDGQYSCTGYTYLVNCGAEFHPNH